MHVKDMARIVSRTEGAIAVSIRELLRRSDLYSAHDKGEIVLEDSHLDLELHKLLVDGGEFTRSLMGARISVDLHSTQS